MAQIPYIQVFAGETTILTGSFFNHGGECRVNIELLNGSLVEGGSWPDVDFAANIVRQVLKRADEEGAVKKAALKGMITVALNGLGVEKSSTPNYAVVDYVYNNRSSKDVRAFEGRVTYRDVLGNEVADTDLKVLTPIKSGQKSSATDTLPFTTFRGLRGVRFEDVEIEWNPNKILFVDGTIETSVTSSFPSATDVARIVATLQKGQV